MARRWRTRFSAFTIMVAACTAACIAPAAASVTQGPGSGADPAFTFTVGGDRTALTNTTGTGAAVAGLNGVTVSATGLTNNAATGSCPTATGSPGTVAPGQGRCSTSFNGLTPQPYRFTQVTIPPGWHANARLGYGPNADEGEDYSSFDSPYNINTGIGINRAVPGTSAQSNPAATTGGVLNGSSGYWAVSRDNPPEPHRCGLRVALLFDLSGSVEPFLDEYKLAAVNFVKALTGTPSTIALYTFAAGLAPATGPNANLFPPVSLADPAEAQNVINRINGFTASGATNWDAGLWQIARDEMTSSVHYDLAIMLTDGVPNRRGTNNNNVGGQPQAVEFGIFSANAIKAQDTRIVAVGIDIADDPGAVDNLAAVSGPQEEDDYWLTDFDALDTVLGNLARSECLGTITVRKLVVPAGNQPGDTTGAQPGPGWQFTFANAGTPGGGGQGVTDDNGVVNFNTEGSTLPTTITEALPAGYRIFPTGNPPANAVCTVAMEDNPTLRETVLVIDTTNGFIVPAYPHGVLSCTVYDQPLEGPTPPPEPPLWIIKAKGRANASPTANANGPVIARPRATANGNFAASDATANGSAYAPSLAIGGGASASPGAAMSGVSADPSLNGPAANDSPSANGYSPADEQAANRIAAITAQIGDRLDAIADRTAAVQGATPDSAANGQAASENPSTTGAGETVVAPGTP